jgi:hypothetical protein
VEPRPLRDGLASRPAGQGKRLQAASLSHLAQDHELSGWFALPETS